MSHDPHFGFIIAAYALALVIVAGMVVAILADYLNLQRALASFAAREKQQDADPRAFARQQMSAQNPDPEGLP